ncbi:hypothetical protein OSB04_017385 [Centaurea solstitialis]|uniref:Reverse transcriptase domain-containing protein n=1 Tax=Centaurea solstitialis TaxID=347529 RepID=A0AA38WIA9_9ASTR|nr:hypothetical protein OSB04_017385 [Centaurea solstitialis]
MKKKMNMIGFAIMHRRGREQGKNKEKKRRVIILGKKKEKGGEEEERERWVQHNDIQQSSGIISLWLMWTQNGVRGWDGVSKGISNGEVLESLSSSRTAYAKNLPILFKKRTAQRGDIGYTSKPIFSKGIPLLTYQSNENVLDYQVNLRRLDLDIEDIKQRLKQCYTENPLQFWVKNQITAKLEMKDKEKEIRVKPMRYNPEDQKEFMIQTKELLDLKLIRISHSPHSSPAFMVRKHSEIARGKARMIFSKFDCKSGFWQIKMHPDSILYTSFSTPQGQYEWLVMPFGLKYAPQIFQRKMDSIFKDYDFIFVYVDDVLIYSDNIESHLKHLDIFIELCIKNGLALSEKKTKLIQEQIDFLGMKIDGKGIELQSHILEKINSFPDKLIDKKQVQSFLGILNYAKPFQDLLKKNKVFSFDKSLENQVKKIKEYCKILPKLQLPKDNDDLILETDASENYWSGVLKKIDYNSGQEKIGESICRYCSGTFTDTQTRYHINEKELLAVVKSCQKLFYFLLPKKFLLRTDNTQVKAFINNNLPSKPEYKRLIRWQTLLSEYNFDIEIIKSDKNVLADFLTRDGKDD